MIMTMAVKNTFGLIPGIRKTQWHFRIGNNPAHFARMLVDLHYRTAPVLSIMDAITAMEGNGPGSGDPVDLGLVIAGADASAIDAVSCRIVGLDPTLLYTLGQAKKARRGTTDLSDITVAGERLDDVCVKGFRFPATGPLISAIPAVFTRAARRILTPRPVIIPDLCIECGRCEKVCPARAITGPPPAKRRAAMPPGRMTIDYTKCIRCFCCQEICPEGAISVRTGWFIRNKV
jgi:ferredoxin